MDGYKPLLETHPHLKDFVPFLDDLNKESARGTVLISASYIENQLGEIISAFLLDDKSSKKLLEGFAAPLGTFSARTNAAKALGLISAEEYLEIETIRKIRNEFAHNHRITFSDPRIVAMCRNLKYSVKESDAHGQFTTAALPLILLLTNRLYYVSEKRLKEVSWPD